MYSILLNSLSSLLLYFPRRLYPPSTLRGMESSLAMLQDPPAWSMNATAPTDWTLLQQAKALRLGESPPPMHFLPDSHRNYHLATTALGMQSPKRKNGWKLLLAVLLVAVAAACYGMRVQPKTVMPSPSTVNAKLVPMTKQKKKHRSAIKTTVKLLDTEGVVNKNEQRRRRRVDVQIHNTSLVNHAIDTNKVMTRKPWLDLWTGPPKVKRKRKQVPKLLERFIVECNKFKWKGQRFLI